MYSYSAIMPCETIERLGLSVVTDKTQAPGSENQSTTPASMMSEISINHCVSASRGKGDDLLI